MARHVVALWVAGVAACCASSTVAAEDFKTVKAKILAGWDKHRSIEAKVELVGEYKPTMYGFGGFKKGVKPADHKL